MNIELRTPAFEELSFRQSLLSDEDTMQYNHAYGGTISFSKERWPSWYDRWILSHSPDYFYRYIFDKDTGNDVGEAAYHKDFENNRYICDVIVMGKYRGNGYGKSALLELLNCAKRNGLNVLYDEIAIDNPSIKLFLNVGFEIESQNREFIRVRIEL